LPGKTVGAPGPEQPTLVERLVAITRLPYAMGCVLIGAIVGDHGFYLAYFADSLNPGKALSGIVDGAFFTVDQFGQPLPLEQGLAVAFLFTAFLVLTLYSARYMRVVSLEVESSIRKLNPDFTEETYHQTFGGISNWKYIVLLTLALSVVYVPPRVLGATGPFSLFSAVVMIPIDFFIIASSLWIYLRTLWGVYSFGAGPLQLVPFYMDRMLGLRPIGAMSLSFGIVYLALDSTALVGGILTADLLNLLVLFGLLVLLAIMLFLPLYGIHRKMIHQKHEERVSLQRRISEIVTSSDSPDRSPTDLSDVTYLLAYKALSDEVSRIPVWPFETGRLERFLTVFLSILAIISARLIQIAFHF